MPLLLDGEEFSLDELARNQLNRDVTYMLPKSAVSRSRTNGKVEINNGVGIPAAYRMIYTDPIMKKQREVEVRYYETARWDDTLRKNVYMPDNVMIEGSTGGNGKLIVGKYQQELNWFLQNHPGLQDGTQRKNYPRYPILFRMLDKGKESRSSIQLYGIKREVMEFVDPNSKTAWGYEKLIAACETLSNDGNFASIPAGANLYVTNEIHNYREYKMIPANDTEAREDAENIMRAALMRLIEAFPEYAKDRLLDSQDRVLNEIVLRVGMTEITGVKYDAANSVWVENYGTPEQKVLMKVAKNQDANRALFLECKKDYKFKAKMHELATKTLQSA